MIHFLCGMAKTIYISKHNLCAAFELRFLLHQSLTRTAAKKWYKVYFESNMQWGVIQSPNRHSCILFAHPLPTLPTAHVIRPAQQRPKGRWLWPPSEWPQRPRIGDSRWQIQIEMDSVTSFEFYANSIGVWLQTAKVSCFKKGPNLGNAFFRDGTVRHSTKRRGMGNTFGKTRITYQRDQRKDAV